MSIETRFFVVRHARPNGDDPDFDNPGIDAPSQQQKIDGTAWTISTILEQENSSNLVIFTSPKRRAMETASALAATRHLLNYTVGDVTPTPDLDENAFDEVGLDQFASRWGTILPSLATTALSLSVEGRMPDILLVTHEPIIRTIPMLRRPNVDSLGINEFTVSVG